MAEDKIERTINRVVTIMIVVIVIMNSAVYLIGEIGGLREAWESGISEDEQKAILGIWDENQIKDKLESFSELTFVEKSELFVYTQAETSNERLISVLFVLIIWLIIWSFFTEVFDYVPFMKYGSSKILGFLIATMAVEINFLKDGAILFYKVAAFLGAFAVPFIVFLGLFVFILQRFFTGSFGRILLKRRLEKLKNQSKKGEAKLTLGTQVMMEAGAEAFKDVKDGK